MSDLSQGRTTLQLNRVLAPFAHDQLVLPVVDPNETVAARRNKGIWLTDLRQAVQNNLSLGNNWEFRQDTRPVARPNDTDLQVNDRWLDYTDQMWWYWSGTNWLSEYIFEANTHCFTSSIRGWAHMPLPKDYDLFFVDFAVGGQFNNPQNVSNYWIINLEMAIGEINSSFIPITSIVFNRFNITTGQYIHGNEINSIEGAFKIKELDIRYIRLATYNYAFPGYIDVTGKTRYRLVKRLNV